jgi:hypothetical protein
MYYTPETLLNHVFEDLRKTKARNNYIQRAHNPRYVRVYRFTTAKDLVKLYYEKLKNLKDAIFPAVFYLLDF